MGYQKIRVLNENNFMQWLDDDSFEEAKVIMTPKLAQKIEIKVKEYVENTGEIVNRAFYLSTAEGFASLMKRGLWNERIGDPMRFFAPGGIQDDGQHRTRAVILSGMTIKFPAIKGLEKKDQIDMDAGKPRNDADIIAIHYGEKYSAQRSALSNHIAKLLAGKARKVDRHAKKSIMDIFKTEMNLVFKNSTQGIQRALRITPVQSCFVISAKIFPKETEQFVRPYFTGNNLNGGSPIKILRDHILEAGRPNYSGPERRQNSLFAFNMLKAYILNTPIKQKKKEFLTSNEGLEFFVSKMPKIKEQIKDLFRY
ncbi:MAG: hypothetical protein KKE05_03675 [Nanoarchaeota archaeon]|nr:hypothetical protein [Nanoarchaeota archaeon]